MSTTIYQANEIPTAYYYCMSDDTFMSGWGPATNKVNTVILPCDSWEEALAVAEYARTRSDQEHVRIVGNKPRLRPGVLYSLYSRDTARAWYPQGQK